MELAGGNGGTGGGLMGDRNQQQQQQQQQQPQQSMQAGAFASNGQTGGFRTPGESLSEKHRTPDGRLVEIKNVWADSLEQEMVVIRELVEAYPYVAMDTEFPGIVARPVGDFNQPDFQYQTLRCNVDMLKMIQLGLSFGNEKGELPENMPCTWQFNFSFNLSEDMYAHDSIQLLKNSGIDFEEHERRGIDVLHFGELLMTSGLVLMPNVTWISFHSGYDFGYLLKLLTCTNLPTQESDFFEMLQLYFPKLYDIKFLASSQDGFHGGLNKLADDLKVERIGPMHQAGSDSLLTEQVFLKVADVFFNGPANMDRGKNKGKFSGQLYGYGGNQTGIYRPGNKQQHNGGIASVHNANMVNMPPTANPTGTTTGGTTNLGALIPIIGSLPATTAAAAAAAAGTAGAGGTAAANQAAPPGTTNQSGENDVTAASGGRGGDGATASPGGEGGETAAEGGGAGNTTEGNAS